MIISDRWEIRKGPMGNDYMLVEKSEYFSDKYQEYRISETPRYYPNMATLAKALARIEGISAIELDTVEQVVAQLESVEEAVLKATS